MDCLNLAYDIEDEVRLQSAEARLAARQQRSVPILGRLEKFLRDQKGQALPKSQYGKAVGCSLNHWTELCRYTENGVLGIDNNIAERTMRLCAIGRNYAEFQIMRSWRRDCRDFQGKCARSTPHNSSCLTGETWQPHRVQKATRQRVSCLDHLDSEQPDRRVSFYNQAGR